MKAGCLFLVGLLALAAALGLLAGLGALRPTAPPPPRPSPAPRVEPGPEPLPESYKEWVDSLHEFRQWEWGGRYSVGYGFIDHHGRPHQMSCSIERAAHERELAGYGYDEAEIDRIADARVRQYLEQELAQRGLSAYVRVKVERGRTSAESEVPSMAADEHARIEAEIKRFYALWDGAIARKREAIEKPLYKERGFLLENHRVSPDYTGLALQGGPALADCFRALGEAGQGYNPRQYLGLFVGFFQEIRYELPPDLIQGRRTLGVFVPTEVLVNDHGDCDSKSVAFAALYRNLGSPVLLIELSHHVLIGAEMRPGPGEKYVLVDNRYYVIGEVAGPGKRRPGDASHDVWNEISGHFRYTVVPAADQGFTRSSR
ncbi:MAG: hypothetical protein ACHQKZ_09900 [Solirubrobacterales bacterium]|jgi:hypothetical protein